MFVLSIGIFYLDLSASSAGGGVLWVVGVWVWWVSMVLGCCGWVLFGCGGLWVWGVVGRVVISMIGLLRLDLSSQLRGCVARIWCRRA